MKKTPIKKEEIIEAKKKCPSCLGTGLWRADFVNSPQCSECIGHGVI